MHRTTVTSLSGALRALIWSVFCVMLLSGCGADAGEPSFDRFGGNNDWYEAPRPTAYERGEELNLAESFLIQHDIRAARAQYDTALEQNDPFVVGTAAAGKSVTRVMLLGDEAPVQELLRDGLGATNSNYDTQRLIWGREGILYWFEQGGRWEDDGSLFLGVKSLVAEDLPWSPSRLDHLAAFVEGLDQDFGKLSPTLVSLADVIREIERDLRVAINDPKFEYLYLPSAVFHDEAFSLALNKSELAALHGVLSMVRGTIHMITAYEHTWTLEQVFGGATPEAAEHIDYAQLDGVWLRSLQRAGALGEARRAYQDGLDLFAQSISLGLELPESQRSELAIIDWDVVSRDDLRILRDLLESLSYALDEPTKMPHYSVDFTLDLTSFFEDNGRVLEPEIDWFIYDEPTQSWGLTDEAEQAFFRVGVLDPEAVSGEPYPAKPVLDQTRIEELIEAMTQRFQDRISETYGL